jgi:hypothetical protein
VPTGLTSALSTLTVKVGGLPLAANHHLCFCPAKIKSVCPCVGFHNVDQTLQFLMGILMVL